MLFRLSTAYDIALSSASTLGPHLIPVGCREVRLTATGDCYVKISTTPVAVAGACTLVRANQPPLIAIVTKGDQIAVIEATGSSGVLNVTELTK